MLVTLSALIIAAAAAPDYQDISHAEAEARARACGFTQVSVAYEDLYQSDVVTVSDPVIEDAQLDCLARAMDQTVYLTFPPTEYLGRFVALQAAVARPRLLPQMEAELREAGYGLPPRYDHSTTTAQQYAEILEQHCGADAAGALSSQYGPNSLSPTWMADGDPLSEEKLAVFSCL